MTRTPLLLALSAALALAASGRLLAADDDAAFYTKSVEPILSERCLGCHGPEKQKAKLRLDSREAVLKGGKSGPAVVPGKPDDSLLIKAVRYTDDDLKMPPKNKKLSDEQIATLVEWVKRGAPFADGAGAKGTGAKPADGKPAEPAKQP
jgi:mono/diheme cytochrome c family protein